MQFGVFMVLGKFQTRSISALNDVEILLEKNTPKVLVSMEMFADDLQYCRENNLNMSRIMRFKFRDWIAELKAKIEAEKLANGIEPISEKTE